MTTYIVSAGQTSSGVTLGSGDVMDVLSGGTALDTIAGGINGITFVMNVRAGGTAIDTIVNDQGLMKVLGTASGTIVERNTDRIPIQLVISGGLAIDTTVSGGEQEVDDLATALNTVIVGGVQILGGFADVGAPQPGGTASGTTLDSGGEQFVQSGGIAVATTVNNGGSENVYSGGLAMGTVINQGGFEGVAGTATASGVTVNGGQLGVEGRVTGTIAINSGVATIGAPVGSGTTISFGGSGSLGIYDLASAPGGVQQQDFNAPIAGLIIGDLISFSISGLGNLSGITNATAGAFNTGTDTTPLAVTSGGTTIATLTLEGNYGGDILQVSPVRNNLVTIGLVLPPFVTEALVDDTGVSPTDAITSNAEVTGGGDPGATVTFSENGAVLGTTTANGSGTWTFLPSLPDGIYTLVASETNPAGTGTASVSFTLDTTPPTPVNDRGLNIAAGGTALITAGLLRFDDNLSNHAQETYTVVTPPAHGEVLLNGSSTSAFTQIEIDRGQVSYSESAGGGPSDAFAFTVSDIAGNTTATEHFNVTLVQPGPYPIAESPLRVAVGTTAPITESLLRFDDSVATHAQETYSIVTAPADGTLLKNGSPTTSFTQADIDNGLISYQENVTGASSDNFSFTVSDSAGNTTALQQYQIAVQPNPPGMLFASAQLGVATFGAAPGAGGWTSDNLYPRLLGDVNGNGMPDIVGFGDAGAYVSIAAGNGSFAQPFLGVANFGSAPAAGGWTSQDTYPREIAYVTGNKMADIVGFGVDGAYVSVAAGGGHFAAPVLAGGFGTAAGWTSQNLYPREMADLTGDGMDDIVAFGASNVYVSTNLGGDQFSFNYQVALQGFGPAQGWFSQQQFPREMAVLTNSGLPDIVGFGSAGVYVSRNLGNGSFAQPVLALNAFGAAGGWISQDVTPRFLADINGDGLADIVGFGSDGVWVSMNLGNGNFAQPVFGFNEFGSSATGGGWTNQSLYPRELADVTGDKRADIVGFGASGVYLSPSLDPIPGGAMLT